MGLLSANMKAELSKGGPGVPGTPEVYAVLEIVWPDGTTKRYGRQGIGSAARGRIEGRVLRFGTVVPAIDPRSNQLQSVEIEPEIADADRTIAKLVSKYPNEIRRSAATIRLMSPNVPDADSFVCFTGIIDAFDMVRSFAWKFRLRPDDSALQLGKIPKVPLASYFQSIHDDVRNAYAPIIYGEHDSDGSGNSGFVPCYLVDTVNNKYAVALGHLKGVGAVYEDGEIISTSDYAVTFETVKGALFTLIDFTSAIAREGAITADVEGLTANPDGTGALLTNWDAVQHWLVNFVFGDWRGGTAWLSAGSAPIDTASVTTVDTFLDLEGHETSIWSGGTEQSRAIEVLNQILDSHEVKAYWNYAGKLTFGFIDHRPPSSIYVSDPWVRADTEEFGEIAFRYDPTSITKEILVNYVPSHAGGSTELLQKLRLMDVTVPDEVVTTLELPNSAARVT